MCPPLPLPSEHQTPHSKRTVEQSIRFYAYVLPSDAIIIGVAGDNVSAWIGASESMIGFGIMLGRLIIPTIYHKILFWLFNAY
jgi:hypothetical protein